MTELDELIEEQAKDDVHWIFPESSSGDALSLQFENLKGTRMDSWGVGHVYDFEDMIECGDYERQPETVQSSFLPKGRAFIAIKHGRIYSYFKLRCRCPECRAVAMVATKKYKANRIKRGVPDHVHGTPNGYHNYDCRCQPCTKAYSAYKRAQKLRRAS